MRFTKAAFIILTLTVATGEVHASSNPIATVSAAVTFNITNTRPTCNITVPPSVDLGTLTPGSKTHAPLVITWTCEGNSPVKTALVASVKKGRANGDEKVTLVTEKDDPIGATLSLREKVGGALIKLTGDSAVKAYFCSDVNAVAGVTRSCTLIPETEAFLSGPFGRALASLRFMVDYP